MNGRVVPRQAFACADCLAERGREWAMAQTILYVLVVVDGRSLCLNHAERRTSAAKA